MAYATTPIPSPHSLADLQAAQRYLAQMMKAQPEAKKLVPAFKALKAMIAVARDEDDVLAEAIALADG